MRLHLLLPYFLLHSLLPSGTLTSQVSISNKHFSKLHQLTVPAWLPFNETNDIAHATPQFWFGNPLTWSVIANVDNEVYDIFGVSSSTKGSKSATLLSGNYTSTHTLFEITAGNALFTLDFFSPVSLGDYVRQSLPFSYLTVIACGINGQNPNVTVYSDIDDTWTGQSGNTAKTLTSESGVSIYELTANGQATYSQSADEMALWGQAIFASQSANGDILKTESGPTETVRKQFAQNGDLSGANTWQLGATNVVAFSQSLGRVGTGKAVRFAVGYVREAAINYLGEPQTHFYRSQFPDIPSAVGQFFEDYEDAYSEAQALDLEVQNTGTSVAGSNYSDILALSVRQIFGAIDLTIPKDALDTANASAFIKEISSDGNANTVDIIFPMLPFFYSLAPKWIRLLIQPIVQYLATGAWPLPYVIHDIGTNYPNATGHNDGQAESMPIEETGNLLILFLAYQQATGDDSFTSEYAGLLSGYADYLEQNGRYPVNQLSTTDGLGAFTNMTSLAIKAAVGLAAYGDLSGRSEFKDKGHSFVSTILANGVGTQISDATKEPFLTLTYGNTSWYLQFNLYPDQLLDTNVFQNTSVFKDQTDFYPTVRQPGGVPIDDGANWGKTDWDCWSAAYATDTKVRDMFINDIWAYITNQLNNMPFSDKYNVADPQAGIGQFRARPTVAAHFAPWALAKKTTKRSLPVPLAEQPASLAGRLVNRAEQLVPVGRRRTRV